MNVIYSKSSFIIFKAHGGYVVYNEHKEFNSGHTHIRKYHIGKMVIDNVINKRIPRTKNKYLLISHIRLSDDINYTKKLKNCLDHSSNKSPKLVKRKRGVVR